MKYKLTKQAWEQIGEQAGWLREAKFGAMYRDEIVKDIQIKKSGSDLPFGEFVVEAITENGHVDNLVELPHEFYESPIYRSKFRDLSRQMIGQTVGTALDAFTELVHDMQEFTSMMGGRRH